MALPILALDLGTRAGYAIGPRHQTPRLGTLLFDQREHPARFRALEGWLDELSSSTGCFSEVIHFAKGGFAGALAMKLHIGFAITVETWCWDNAVPYRTEFETTARKLILGRGTFKKDMAKPAVEAWARQAGLADQTHDAYDAALLHRWASLVPR